MACIAAQRRLPDLLSVSVGLLAACSVASLASTATVSVNASSSLGTIPPQAFGVNTAVWDGNLHPAARIAGLVGWLDVDRKLPDYLQPEDERVEHIDRYGAVQRCDTALSTRRAVLRFWGMDRRLLHRLGELVGGDGVPQSGRARA